MVISFFFDSTLWLFGGFLHSSCRPAQFARAVEVPDCDRNLAGGCVGAPVAFYQQRFYAPMLASIDQNIPKLDEAR